MPSSDVARRSLSAGANARDAIFVKDGRPVTFFFHTSVREGRDVLERQITRYGGDVCEDEEIANVILVDEEADIEHIRRRYYRSNVLWQQRVCIEQRDFVRRCIGDRKYEHYRPARKGMPGAPGRRARIPFTADDDNHLAFYIATVYPKASDGGRTGNLLYYDLTKLADEPEYRGWAKKHTWQSWRERYRMNRVRFDPMIARYAALLKPLTHGLGHDPRSRRYRRGRIVQREEEEEESDQELEQQAEGGAGLNDLDNLVPDGVPQARNQVQDNGMPDHEPGPVQSQLRRRRRDDPDTSPRVNFQGELHRKRQRVASPVTPSRPRTSALEKGRRAIGYKSSSRISNENDERSSEERNRRFARGVLDGAISFDNDQMPQFDVLPVPRSPEHDAPAAQSDDEPMATQQTLVNSPNARSSPSGRATAVVVRAASMSSQAISITQRAARRPPSRHRRAQRDQSPVAEVRTSAASNPQVKRTRMSGRHQPAVTASDAPYRHTRARSQSVDLPPQPASASKRRRVVSAKGKMKELELEEVPEEDAERKGEPSNQGPQISNHRPEAETFQEQQDVADYLLKEGSLFGDDEQSDEPTHGQEFTVDSSEDPSDSDDVATHKNLQHSGQRLNRMAAAGFRTRLRSNTSVSASNKMATRSPVI